MLNRWLPLLVIALTCARSVAQCGEWTVALPEQPRNTAAPIFLDTTQNKVGLFELAPGSNEQMCLWQWNGQYWVPGAPLSTPVPWRGQFKHAYDAARQQLVCVARAASGSRTLLWNGATWTSAQVASPPWNVEPSMTFDVARGRVVYFSGSGVGQTWEWDGLSWTLRTTVGPGDRWGATLAYDAARQRVVLFGGYRYAGVVIYLSDTWEWDGEAWTQRQVQGPSPRVMASAAYDPSTQRLILFGGMAGTNPTVMPDDTWAWDGTGWSRLQVPGPPGRAGAGMVHNPITNRIMLMGGTLAPTKSYGDFNDTWEWDGQQWTKRGPVAPSNRQDHAMAYDAARDEMVLFGGYQTNSWTSPLGDTWLWNGETWRQYEGAGPSGRTRAVMAYDPIRQRVVMFGGGAQSLSPETWEWDGDAWALRAVVGPSPRSGHAMTFDPARQGVLLYGGQVAGQPSAEQWLWSGESWSRLADGPRAASSARMSFDTGRQRLVLFLSPASVYGPPDETWEWDGHDWVPFIQRLELGGSLGRANAGFAYDPVRRAVVMHGGGSPLATYSSVMEWNGWFWYQRQAHSSLYRYGAPMAYDSLRGRMLMFGGQGTVVRGDTIVLASSPAPPRLLVRPASVTVNAGADVTLSVGAESIEPLSYQWRFGSTLLTDMIDAPMAREITGASSPNLTLRGVRAPGGFARFTIQCTVSNACATLPPLEASVTVLPCSADFDNDGDAGTDQDIEAFFTCLGGHCCPTCGSADFNGDRDTGTDQDIEAFFRVLGGGHC
ncbi:MAG TPA: immunoglobulin domain-containing protein [Phycisphaerales bacterium]|nr:immunoglobulin domain-containing protein [Phycisphaerales bacterium]